MEETTDTSAATTAATTTEPTATPADTHAPEPTASTEPKPFLGGNGTPDPQATEPKADEKTADPPKDYGADDYVKGIQKDEALLGTDKNVQIDADYIKAMAPAFKEAGLTPEQANKLANAFAKVQVDSAREALKGRMEYFEKMKQESLRTYNEGDWRQINAAIDANFKKDGVMNYVIRNSELGADPEFLALLHKLGASVKSDTVAGTGAGAGNGTGDANTFAGISSMW